jgi:hypothetical protein
MSGAVKREQLRQRSDYTYKFNAKTGRHGWLRLTPAYSVKIVEEVIVDHGQARRIFDPFCGTGTTALSAVYHGHEGVTTDINPFLIWLAQAKTAHYSPGQIASTREACAIVGNSTFYGNLISTELVYAEMLAELGFDKIECRAIRKRNSKKELVEFDVIARWR